MSENLIVVNESEAYEILEEAMQNGVVSPWDVNQGNYDLQIVMEKMGYTLEEEE